MKNFKLNINRQIPSSEVINSRKDFGSLMKDAAAIKSNQKWNSKNWIKPSLFVVTVLVVTLALLIQFKHTDKKNISQNKKELNNNSYVKAPVKSINSAFEIFKIANNKENKLHHSSGTTIFINPYTFGSKNDSIEIRYREFKTPCEMLFSGIPMTYDSCGKTYQFESGGMFELLAFKNGKPIQIAKNKEIKIDFIASTRDKSFNFYELDTNRKCWKYIGKEENTKNDMTYQYNDYKDNQHEINILDVSQIDETNKKLEAELPPLPSQPDKKHYRFNIDVEKKDFPELANYKDLQFEIVSSDRVFGKEIYSITWESAEIKQSKKGLYKLNLSSKNAKYNFYIKPVFEGKDYDSAMTVYNKAFSKYETEIANNKKIKNNLELKYQRTKMNIDAQSKNHAEKIEIQNDKMQVQKGIVEGLIKTYEIKATGIYNCDKPVELPQGKDVYFTYRNSDNEQLKIAHAFLITNDRNSYYNISLKKILSFNPKKKNCIVVIDEEGNIGLIDNNVFSKITQGTSKCVFSPVFYSSIKSPKDLEALING
ncbi:MAG: hypothetical protein WCK02_17660 [Bacteroidota bacterium]